MFSLLDKQIVKIISLLMSNHVGNTLRMLFLKEMARKGTQIEMEEGDEEL